MYQVRCYSTVVAAFLIAAFSGPSRVMAEESSGHSHEQAEVHGGSVTMTQEFHFETLFLPDEVRVYVYDGKQHPLPVEQDEKGSIRGTVKIEFRDSSRASIEKTFNAVRPTAEQPTEGEGHGHHNEAEEEHHGHDDMAPQGYLAAKVDLANLKSGEARARFALENLPGEKEKEARFIQKVVVHIPEKEPVPSTEKETEHEAHQHTH